MKPLGEFAQKKPKPPQSGFFVARSMRAFLSPLRAGFVISEAFNAQREETSCK
jgi:hypothetical protein